MLSLSRVNLDRPIMFGIRDTDSSMIPQEQAYELELTGTDEVPVNGGSLYAIAMPISDIDGLQFLATAQEGLRYYWAEPDSAEAVGIKLAGSGVAAELMTMPVLATMTEEESNEQNRFRAIRQQALALFADNQCREVTDLVTRETQPMAHDHPARPRLFGGFAFSPEFVPDNTWSVFLPAHFILPHFQFSESHGTQWLTINALLSPDESQESVESSLLEALLTAYEVLCARVAMLDKPEQNSPAAQRSLSETRYPMSLAQWESMVTQATSAIADGRFEKVVLSRVGELRLGEPVDAVGVLRRLSNDYADCYRFLFEPLEDHAFIGATPELLIDLERNVFHTVALAGSIKRGRTLAEDDGLAAALLASTKDRHEHEVVVNELKLRLSSVSNTLAMPAEPGVQRLQNIQHLRTPVQGIVSDREQVDVLTLVQLLHPTPALGGLPAPSALRFLAEVEPVPRGWYAAPVGWIDSQMNGTFAVAIRSAVCWRERAWLYAGAGIVGDSQPANEWAETELKFRPMLKSLLPQD